jgi:SAM-dependent methyltransferase
MPGTRYALLVAPAANRVYADAAPALVAAELATLDELAPGACITDVGLADIAGVPYVGFSVPDRGKAPPELDAPVEALVANLSARYALFAQSGELLRPVRLRGMDRWPEDLVTIPRYTGKTNEQLTKLLVNLALAAGHGVDGFSGRRLRILDPLCGRGTTLNQAIRYGLDVAGIDLDGRDIEAWAAFFTSWLKDKRVKHHVERRRVRRDGRVSGSRVEVRIGAEGADETRRAEVVTADTTEAVALFGAASVDAIVTDLPYGVAHGSVVGGRRARRPGELFGAALPAWRRVLRPGAALAVAWNVKTLTRADAISALAGADFEVLVSDGRFEHRVDRTITRDVIVARRPPVPVDHAG